MRCNHSTDARFTHLHPERRGSPRRFTHATFQASLIQIFSSKVSAFTPASPPIPSGRRGTRVGKGMNWTSSPSTASFGTGAGDEPSISRSYREAKPPEKLSNHRYDRSLFCQLQRRFNGVSPGRASELQAVLTAWRTPSRYSENASFSGVVRSEVCNSKPLVAAFGHFSAHQDDCVQRQVLRLPSSRDILYYLHR